MLKEIRKQPEHIRALFMWLSVFIVFSFIVFVWVKSFETKLVALLHPDETQSALVQEESPFAVVGKSFIDLKATISDLFGLAKGTKKESEVIDNIEERGVEIEPRLLPIPEDN